MWRRWPVWPPPLLPAVRILFLRASWNPGKDAAALIDPTHSATTALSIPHTNDVISKKVIIHQAEKRNTVITWSFSFNALCRLRVMGAAWPAKFTYRSLQSFDGLWVFWVFEVPLWSILAQGEFKGVHVPRSSCIETSSLLCVGRCENINSSTWSAVYWRSYWKCPATIILVEHICLSMRLWLKGETLRLQYYFLVWMKIEDVVLFTCLCIMSEDYIYNYVVDNPHIISTITFEDIWRHRLTRVDHFGFAVSLVYFTQHVWIV